MQPQHYRRHLDTAVRLAAMSNKPHGVAQTVLLYHEQLYHTLEKFQGCPKCQPTIIATKQALVSLQARCSYFQAHLVAFGQAELKQLMKETVVILDLSSWCESCRKQFQEQSAAAFSVQLQQLQPMAIRYHLSQKKRKHSC